MMSAMLPVLFLAVSYFLPESPIWLMKKKKYEETEKTLEALRGSGYCMKMELQDIQYVSDNSVQATTTGFWNSVNELKSRQVMMPIFMMLTMFILQVSCFNFLEVNHS